jgi:hypothetical protein
MTLRSIVPGLVLILAAGRVCAADPSPPVVLRGAVIETAGKAGRIENGVVVLRGGKVEAVGTDVKVPDDARVIDLGGKTIMPGLIDPYREVTIAAARADTGPRTVVIGGRTITIPAGAGGGGAGFTRIADNFYPYEPSYRTFVRSGITGMNLVTSGYCQSALVRVRPATPDAMMLNPDGFIFTQVTNDASSLDTVRNALQTATRRGGGRPSETPTPPAGEAGPGRGPRQGPGSGRPGGGFGAGGGTVNLKAWQDIAEGKAPLFVTAANAAAVVHLFKALEPYKDVKLVLAASGPTLQETLDRLQPGKVRVLVRPGLSLVPNTRDRADVARLLHEAGIEFAFTQPATQADLTAMQDSPLFPVAYSVRCGLPRKAALEALTARPATLLGLGKTHGTIEPGKSADLLIFTGDPLDPESQLARVLIEGRTVYEN